MRKLSDAQRDEIVELYTTPAPDGTWRGCYHIDRDKGNNEPCNLVSLCRRCHGWVHSPRNAASVFREW